jgi:succinate-semialdehyde dehydrogenase/glutarate-semialdehyde dehydrogenase
MSGLDLLSSEHRRLFIGGTWREAHSGATLSVRDPADGSVITEISDGDVNDAVDALDAAVAAQQEWGTTAPRERGEILRRAFELITKRGDDFAELMSLEMGKTVKEAKGGSPTARSSSGGSARRPCASTAAGCRTPQAAAGC